MAKASSSPGEQGIQAARQDAERAVSDQRFDDMAWAILEYGVINELTVDELKVAIDLYIEHDWGFQVWSLYDNDNKPISYGIKRD